MYVKYVRMYFIGQTFGTTSGLFKNMRQNNVGDVISELNCELSVKLSKLKSF